MARSLLPALLLALLLPGCGGAGRQVRKADRYLEAGRAKAAARLYDDVLVDHPDRQDALVGAALAWSLADEPQTALARAERAQAEGARGGEEGHARALLALGRGQEAIPLLEGAGLPLLLAEAELAAGRFADARAVLPAPGQDPGADLLRAWLIHREGEPGACARAMPLAMGAARLAPEDAEINAEASWLATACQQPADARELHLVARAFEQQDAETRLLRADLRLDGGDPEGAARLLARAEALWPQDGRVARELGLAWLEADQPARAVETLRRALPLPPYEQDPQQHQIIVGGHGYSPQERGRLVQDLLRTLALAHDRAGQPVDGASALERALLAAPEATAEAWAEQARRWVQVGAGRRGVDAARRALQLHSDSWVAWTALAEASLAAGQAPEAVGAGRKAWALAPGRPEAAVALARAALAVGERAEALRVLESALKELGPRVHPLSPTLQALLREASR
ncbi:tetratricopeptide repeat protein [Myxococcota bacterium]|nr:tetratricopeptide repeat protein [Myxococcota bacterium]